MGVEIEQEEGETWEAYVERSAHFCRETMNREQQNGMLTQDMFTFCSVFV